LLVSGALVRLTGMAKPTELGHDADTPPTVPDEAAPAPEQSWSTTRTAQAKALFPSITDVVSTRIDQLLTGAFSERQQTNTELKAIAWELLKANVPTPPKTETPQ